MQRFVAGSECKRWTDGDMASKLGHLDLMKSNRLLKYTPKSMEYAASIGHLQIIQWLHENACGSAKTLFPTTKTAAEKGHLGVVEWLVLQSKDKFVELSQDAMLSAAGGGSIQVVEWAFQKMQNNHCDKKPADPSQKHGSQQTKPAEHSTSHSVMQLSLVNASRGGHLETVAWLHKAYTCAQPKRRDEGIPGTAMIAAAASGRLDVLEWLHWKGNEGRRPSKQVVQLLYDTTVIYQKKPLLHWLKKNLPLNRRELHSLESKLKCFWGLSLRPASVGHQLASIS